MAQDTTLTRYSIISEKNCREIVLLIGSGCKWKKCTFCDYHYDFDKDENVCFKINENELNKVTGVYQKLEVINSGSFIELDDKTMKKIEEIVLQKNIKELHFECHWKYREEIPKIKEKFEKLGVLVNMKIGVETFDYLFRESYLLKGIDTQSPQEIAKYFDEVCLLQGLPGQSLEHMLEDIQIGLKFFKRVCINIMQDNKKSIRADKRVIEKFKEYIYPIYKDNDNVDILMENTDFGVGGL